MGAQMGELIRIAASEVDTIPHRLRQSGIVVLSKSKTKDEWALRCEKDGSTVLLTVFLSGKGSPLHVPDDATVTATVSCPWTFSPAKIVRNRHLVVRIFDVLDCNVGTSKQEPDRPGSLSKSEQSVSQKPPPMTASSRPTMQANSSPVPHTRLVWLPVYLLVGVTSVVLCSLLVMFMLPRKISGTIVYKGVPSHLEVIRRGIEIYRTENDGAFPHGTGDSNLDLWLLYPKYVCDPRILWDPPDTRGLPSLAAIKNGTAPKEWIKQTGFTYLNSVGDKEEQILLYQKRCDSGMRWVLRKSGKVEHLREGDFVVEISSRDFPLPTPNP